MLKFARNALCTFGTLHSARGQIKWHCIAKLIQLQQEEGFSLGNKVTNRHLQWQQMKMKVSLAAQTLSSSVADAIAFMRDIMKHPDFAESEATCEFLHIIDRLFDFTNSRNPFEKGFKAPLSKKNEIQWQKVFTESVDYFAQLKCSGDVSLLTHARKTFAVGFIMTAKSVAAVASELLNRPTAPFRYVLPYKMSQDHLELFFSCIRSRGGRNNNPNVMQLKNAMRQILLHNNIRASKQANCLLLDEEGHGSLFEIRSSKRSAFLIEKDEKDEVDEATTAFLEDEALEELINQIDNTELTELKQNILYYIAGFVVRKIQRKIKCTPCLEALFRHNIPVSVNSEIILSKSNYRSFTTYINRGGLLFPADAVYTIVETTEKFFQQMVLQKESKITKDQRLTDKLVAATARKLDVQQLFPSLADHYNANELGTEDVHATQLLKEIVGQYARIRLLTYARQHTRETVNSNRASIRHKNLKLTLFNHM